MKNSTILIVDDSLSNLEMVSEILHAYNVIKSTCGYDAIQIAKEEDIDLVLLDVMMPDMNGYEVCESMKRLFIDKYVPIIFITSEHEEINVEKAYDVGGIDYVSKPFKAVELLARVKIQLYLNKVMGELRYASSHDQLTDTYNRRKFFELATKRFENHRENLNVVMIDLDRFKLINDTYGHHTGDMVLKYFADQVKSIIGDDDIFGRLGGEEFGVICNRPDQSLVIDKIEELRKSVETLKIITEDNQVVQFTISIGISRYSGKEKSIDEIMRVADEMLYKAKKNGRNRVTVRDSREH